jgi:glycosyltransferase involved in cell wall biosynthesis
LNDQIRILAILGSRVLYGMERANIRALETLKVAGCQVLVVVEDHPDFPAIPNELARRHIDYVAAPFGGRRIEGYLLHFLLKNPILLLAGNWKIYQFIRKFSPTHILIPNPYYFLNCMLALTFSQVPVVYRIGDEPSLHNVFWRFLWRRIVSRVNHFVADSKFIAEKLDGMGVPSEHITVIYSAPPSRKGHPDPDRLPDNTQHFLFIGQLGAHKGIDLLIEAFRCIAPIYPQARMTIIGRISEWRGDDWARTLRGYTLADPLLLDRVTFVGETEDIFQYLASAAVLVVPSVWEEPLGIVAVEAKVSARPSVVFPRGGLPELIEDGVDGYICRDTSVESLVEGLCYYLNDPDRTLAHGRAALASISRLGIDRFAEAWLKVCKCNLTNNEGLSESLT